jgi:hypothetical protein
MFEVRLILVGTETSQTLSAPETWKPLSKWVGNSVPITLEMGGWRGPTSELKENNIMLSFDGCMEPVQGNQQHPQFNNQL